MKLLISHITRTSLHDGPGMRDVVYFKGCPLRCVWCHNPEAMQAGRQVLFRPDKCIGCMRCISVCPNECHVQQNGRHALLRDRCARCMRCADLCPTDALTQDGKWVEAEELLQQFLRSRGYYRATDGGITLSGGECLLQSEGAGCLLSLCREQGIHTAVESALHVDRETLERVMPHCDLFIVDIKLMDGAAHRRYTGRDNEQILQNIRYLAQNGQRLWVRTPMIPGMTDGEENLRAIAAFVSTLGTAERYEILRYNDLAGSKYDALGLAYATAALSPQSDGEMQRLLNIAKQALSPGIMAAYS